ncbi:MAG: hypothetical protein A2W23_06540 [Planctomycetes bacterium RBG_16_43_13]|nr:MAG: hypothetical protein A2W23_06540 [Planctomycetes bacterium RBG_16_43_13]
MIWRNNMRCIGFNKTEGKCINKAGTAWSDYWCEECDKVRRDTVRKQLEAIQKHMEDECQKWTSPAPRTTCVSAPRDGWTGLRRYGNGISILIIYCQTGTGCLMSLY